MTKISSLTALTGAGTDTAADLIPVVDMSETGSARNKKQTYAEFLLALKEGIQDIVGAMALEGTNVTLNYDDAANTLTINATSPVPGDISGLNEAIDDRVAALLQEGSGINLTYNDGAGTLTVEATASGGYVPGGTDVAIADGGTGASDASGARTNLDLYSTGEVDALIAAIDGGEPLALPAEWTPNFSADSDLYIAASVAMTVDEGNATIGTGSLAFEKSTTAAPSTFSSTTLPATLEAGAWLKVIASGVSGFLAAHIVRTA